MRKSLLTSLLATAAGVGMTASWAGQVVGPVRLQDQFGHEHTLAADTRRIYFTHDMDGGKLLKAALGDRGQAVLDAQHAVAITDISGMPAMIRRMMALPAMKKRSYRIWLDATGKLVAGWPREPGKVTVMELDDFSITGTTFAGDEPTLEAIVQPR
jgi:NADPH-dependent ferric siderophore reductase